MRNAILTLALFAVSAIAAPAPYPVTINSRAQTAPPLTVYRAAESLFRVSFVDGDTASDITGATAFMSFATNATATVVSTASVSVVAGMTGVVDCVFSPSAVNVPAGRYMYEVGVTPTGGTARIYRQGVFTVAASPYAGSAAAVTWATNMNWETINWIGLPNWLLVSETAGWETGSHAGFVTNSADFYPVSNPSNYITIADVPAQTSQLYVASAGTVTGSQSNLIATALQSEADLAALRLYHYGSPDIVETTNTAFGFSAGEITSYNQGIGGLNVVIPWQINGVPVTTIGAEAFLMSGIVSVAAPQTVTTIGDSAFANCTSLASVSLPQVQTVGSSAFSSCISLASVYFGNDAPTIGAGIFAGITPNQVTNYVTSATATGWGATLGDMPVVRLPLYADALTLGGVTHTNWPSADVSGLATTQSVAAVAGDLDAAQIDINNHTANGTIGSDAHLQAGDRALIDSVPGITQSVAAVSGAFAGFTNSVPAAGCSVLSMTDETNLVVTGATYAYTAQVTTNYWLSIAPTAPAYHYSLTVYGTNACTLADNMRLIGTKTVTGTNCVAFKPWTNGLWEVMWGGK